MSNPKLRLVMMLKGYHVTAGNTVVKRMLHKVAFGDPVENITPRTRKLVKETVFAN